MCVVCVVCVVCAICVEEGSATGENARKPERRVSVHWLVRRFGKREVWHCGFGKEQEVETRHERKGGVGEGEHHGRRHEGKLEGIERTSRKVPAQDTDYTPSNVPSSGSFRKWLF
jgi:hypothetical protein